MTTYTKTWNYNNAGATWVDEAVVKDENQLASRTPKDLALFAKAFVDMLR